MGEVMKVSGILAVALAASITYVATARAADAAYAGKRQAAPNTQSAKNKKLVLEAYQGLFGDHDLSVVDKYWSKDYIQPNPYMSDGRDSVKDFVRKMGMQNWPKFKVNFLRVAADGDLVFLQTVQPKTDKTPETVVVDIFRVENDKIVEHWDTIQAVPSDATNKRPMY
jgi:predicted SnoaL-like aldol condensation-catalyzing enzyme